MYSIKFHEAKINLKRRKRFRDVVDIKMHYSFPGKLDPDSLHGFRKSGCTDDYGGMTDAGRQTPDAHVSWPKVF